MFIKYQTVIKILPTGGGEGGYVKGREGGRVGNIYKYVLIKEIVLREIDALKNAEKIFYNLF